MAITKEGKAIEHAITRYFDLAGTGALGAILEMLNSELSRRYFNSTGNAHEAFSAELEEIEQFRKFGARRAPADYKIQRPANHGRHYIIALTPKAAARCPYSECPDFQSYQVKEQLERDGYSVVFEDEITE